MIRNVEKLADLEALGDGRFARHFAAACQEVYESIRRMPSVEKARKLVLTLEFQPIATDTGRLHSVGIAGKIKVAKPERVVDGVVCKPVRQGEELLGLIWKDDSPDDPDQETMRFDEQKGG